MYLNIAIRIHPEFPIKREVSNGAISFLTFLQDFLCLLLLRDVMARTDNCNEILVCIENRGGTGIDRKRMAVAVPYDVLSGPDLPLLKVFPDFPCLFLRKLPEG